MIQNYMACSIQKYGSDAFRFTLRSVIHSLYTHPSHKEKNHYLLKSSVWGSVKDSNLPLCQAFPMCKQTPPDKQ